MCMWQSITNVLDGYFYLLMAAAAAAIFALAIIGVAAHAEMDTDRHTNRRIGKASDEDEEGPSDFLLSTTSYAWFVPVRRVLVLIILMLFAYPLASPTFCMNVKCAKPFPQLFQPDPSCGRTPPASPLT